jgi:hypothetical protein
MHGINNVKKKLKKKFSLCEISGFRRGTSTKSENDRKTRSRMDARLHRRVNLCTTQRQNVAFQLRLPLTV